MFLNYVKKYKIGLEIYFKYNYRFCGIFRWVENTSFL